MLCSSTHSSDGIVGVPTTTNAPYQEPDMPPGMWHPEQSKMIGHSELLLVVWGSTLWLLMLLYLLTVNLFIC